jgi:hypothetical protein
MPPLPRDRDGTRCFTEKVPRNLPLTPLQPSPTRSGRARGGAAPRQTKSFGLHVLLGALGGLVVRDPDAVQTGRDTLFHRENPANSARASTGQPVVGERRGTGHERAGTGLNGDGTDSASDCSRGPGRQSPIKNLRRGRRSGHNRANDTDSGHDRLVGQRSQTRLTRLSRLVGA